MTESSAVPQSGKERIVFQVMAGGALVAIVSLFLKWASVTLDVTELGGSSASESKTGIQTSDGKIILVMAVAAMVLALAIGARKARGKILPILGLALAALMLLITILDVATTKTDTRKDLEKELRKAGQADEQAVQAISSRLNVELGIGLFIAIGGGAILLVGSALGLGLRTPDEFAAAPPAPPSGADSSEALPSPAEDVPPPPMQPPPEPPTGDPPPPE